MKNFGKKSDDISVYIEDQEYIANIYVMKCFTVTMLVYTLTFVLNVLGIFVIEQRLMNCAYIPSMMIYLVVYLISRFVSPSNSKMKYFILFSTVLVFTITGVFITYHVVIISLLPFLYASIYSSKRVMQFVYFLTVISTVIIVYGGYYWGLCDANMALLTTGSLQGYLVDGSFILTEVNSNPIYTLMLFFVVPRCLIYVAFVSVCSSIIRIVRDSLEKAKLTAELEKAKEEAENANRAKSQFLARVSHEIRTPINAVMGMNEMIIRESAEENIREYAYEVKESSVLLLHIVNDILDSSKIESGKMEIVCVNYQIGSLLNDLYNMTSIKAKEKGLDLIFDVDATIPSGYYGDDKRIRQVLLNLLSNAVKYTLKGQVVLKVTSKIEGENAILHYSVKDTGIGIKAEDIDKIYDEFQRFDVAKNRNIEGSGLGMKIAQQFLKLMGSELQIQSEYEKGSEFSFDIAQKIVDVKPLGDFRERLQTTKEKENYRVTFTAPEAKILVVDDNKMNLKVFKNLLKSTQMQIFEAESGKQCLNMLKQQTYDVVFLDHMMPEMDGIETLHAIHDNQLCKRVPIIMLTANAIVGDKEKYIMEGFDDFLSKPIMPDKLEQMILKHLPEKYVVTDEEKEVQPMSVQSELSVLEQLKERLPELNYEKGLTTCSKDEDFYLELIQDFTKLHIREELTKYLEESDYKNYCIRIHGFKNNAYSIGAMELGDLAYKMEMLTKENLPEEIKELQNSLMEQYNRICLGYNEVTKRR